MLFQQISSKEIGQYNAMLKKKITSFLMEFRAKLNRYPIKDINKFVNHYSYKQLGKLIINGESIEGPVVVLQIQKKYKELKKKANPSYFNVILQNYRHDATKAKRNGRPTVKEVYKEYNEELLSSFKQMELDLDFLTSGLKEIVKYIKAFNKSNLKGKNNIEIDNESEEE